MTKLQNHLLAFSAGYPEEIALYESFQDYWNQARTERFGSKKNYEYTKVDRTGKPITFAQKEEALNQAMIRAIGRRAGVDFTSAPLEQFTSHPNVCWAAGLIASAMIDAILPDTILDSIGAYSEVKTIGYGESALFDIKSRDLFPVSRAGNLSMRQAEVRKAYRGQKTLVPEMREVTVGVTLYRVLAGLESLADFTVKVLRSIETEMAKDVYTTFNTAMSLLATDATTGLNVTGYTQESMTLLAQKVQAFSGGAAPIILGTKVALGKIWPDDANYRYDVTSDVVKVGYLRQIAGVATFELPQVADWTNPFATYLGNDRLFIIAPGTDHLVKLVIGGSMISNINNTFDKATLVQNATFWKSWKSGIITSSVAGIITL